MKNGSFSLFFEYLYKGTFPNPSSAIREAQPLTDQMNFRNGLQPPQPQAPPLF